MALSLKCHGRIEHSWQRGTTTAQNVRLGDPHRGKLWIVLIITLSVIIAQVIGELLTNSLALLSDAAHTATATLGLIANVIAMLILRAGARESAHATPRTPWRESSQPPHIVCDSFDFTADRVAIAGQPFGPAGVTTGGHTAGVFTTRFH